jgi:hypothetical protein
VDCEVAFWGGNLRSIDFNVTALISLVPAIGGRMRARGHGGIPIDPHADSPESVAAKTLDDVARQDELLPRKGVAPPHHHPGVQRPAAFHSRAQGGHNLRARAGTDRAAVFVVVDVADPVMSLAVRGGCA